MQSLQGSRGILTRSVGSNIGSNTVAQQARAFGMVKKPPATAVRIETKMGVGLRYRRARTWDDHKKDDTAQTYSKDEIKAWRMQFSLPQMNHSLGSSSYTDDEILAWRAVFDSWAGAKQLINLKSFQQLISEKYGDSIPEKELPTLVMKQWTKFDLDGNNFIDFGEFCKVSYRFDADRLREMILKKGNAKDLFLKEAVDGFITEEGIFDLMSGYKFTCSTTSDMRKLLAEMDKDKDGMVSEQDWQAWLDRKPRE